MSDHVDKFKKELDEKPTEVEKLRFALLQMLKEAGDVIRAFQYKSDFVFNKDIPWNLLNNMGYIGRECRPLLGPHGLWDLTNDLEAANRMKAALNPPDIEELENAAVKALHESA